MVKGIMIAVLFGVTGFYGGRYYHRPDVGKHEHLAFVYGYNEGVFDAAKANNDLDLELEVCPHESKAQRMEKLDLPDFDVDGKLAGLQSDLRRFCENPHIGNSTDGDDNNNVTRRNDN